MVAGPLKSIMAGAAAVGLVSTGPLTGNALAEDARIINTSASTQQNPIVQAGSQGMKYNGVGVLIYYGAGNGSPADAVGEYVVGLLEDYATEKRDHIDAAFFVDEIPNMTGIRVEYYVGSNGVASQDIETAIENRTFEQVLEKREAANQVLQMASLDR